MKTKPRLGVAVLVTDDRGRLLLGRRGKQPNYGRWVIPGGGVEPGEHWFETAAREVFEETGLRVKVDPTERPFILEILTKTEHRVILCVTAYAGRARKLKASSDLLDARFFDLCNLPISISPAVRPALKAFGWN
jgi:ADP-ribose pyrophosphatase YjhB (NUDIX family)